jgi:hypothetical protein
MVWDIVRGTGFLVVASGRLVLFVRVFGFVVRSVREVELVDPVVESNLEFLGTKVVEILNQMVRNFFVAWFAFRRILLGE